MKDKDMDQSFHTTCKVEYVDLSGGFWGLVSLSGEQWRPLNFPEELKQKGITTEFLLLPLEEDFSVFMWGTAVKILDFNPISF